MLSEPTYGTTRSGKPITEDLVDELVAKIEGDLDVDAILKRRAGRPPMSPTAATAESVRLDPELRDALRERAIHEGRTNSELIRDALRQYLLAS